MYMTWIGSLLYCRSCSPRITRWRDGLKKKEINQEDDQSVGRLIVLLQHSSDLLHTAVSSSDNPVLVDQWSSTEVESSAILQ